MDASISIEFESSSELGSPVSSADESETDITTTTMATTAAAAVVTGPTPVCSLLSVLKQAPAAAANRKRKVAQNDRTRQRQRQRHKTPKTAHDPKVV